MTNSLIEDYYTGMVDELIKIVEIYRFKGKYDKAMLLLNFTKTFMNFPEVKQEDKAKMLIKFAQIRMDHKFIKEFDYNEEMNMLKEAQKLAEQSDNKELKAEAIDLTGNCIYRSKLLGGNFEDALPYYKDAFSIRTQLDDKLGLSKSYFHLGLFHDNKKDSDDNDKLTALGYYRKGLDVAIEGDFKLEQSYFYRHLAGYYAFVKEELDKGLEFFIKSMKLREEIGFDYSLQFAYFSVAFVFFLKKDYLNSEKFFLKAYSTAIDVGRLEALKVLISHRGNDIVEEIDSEAAKTYFNILLKIVNQLKDHEGAKEIELRIKELKI